MKKLDDLIKEKESLFEKLEKTNLPIVLWGMGDGAVKLLSILEKRGIVCRGVFASDEFARYNEFHSFTVKKLSDIEKEFDDFIILTAFASRIDEVCDKILEVSKKHTLFVPDINVVRDATEVFDRRFYEENRERLERVFNALEPFSKEAFAAIINFKLSGKCEYLERLEELRKTEFLPYDKNKITSFADFGAYNGDTIIEALNTYPGLKKIAGFEPDEKTFKKLEKNCASLSVTPELFNAVVYRENTLLELFEGAGKNTLLQKNANENASLQDKKHRTVTAFRADSALTFTPDLIKMDVEGSETEALEGCRGFFENARPVLRISIYHNNRDLFEIFEKIEEIKKGYKFSLSQKCRYIPAWDIELVAY